MADAGSRATPTSTGIPEITIGSHITNFGVYDITVSGVASGGMGLVAWGPNRARGGQMQAVKLPRPDRLAVADPQKRAEIVADFEQEALTWCHLWAHPCIISADSLLRLDALGGLPAIFLEYASEGSLRDWLHRVHHPGSTQTLGLEAVFAWGQMIAAALAIIHQPALDLERPEPLVHCDLKPENVLLSAKGWAMLTDLGLTRALASLADVAPQPDVAPDATVIAADDGQSNQGALAGLSAEQQAQAAHLRSLLAQAGVKLPSNATAPASSALVEGAIYGTRTICISPAQQAALAQVVSDQSNASALPALLPSATAVLAQMGSRGKVAGTPQYMAPEQWLGLDAVEPASDVYALGVMLFELFAGVGGRAAYPHTPDPWLVLSAGPFAAWCAAHGQGPSRHLSDPEVAALSDGPLFKLRQDRQQAEAVLAGMDALIGDCLAVSPTARPTAKIVQERLAGLAAQAGLEPFTIPEYPRTPEVESLFWGNLAITYGSMGRPDDQLRLQRKAVALTPDDPQDRVTLGNAFRELAQVERRAAQAAAREGEQARSQQLEAQARNHLEEAVRTFQEAEGLLTPEWLEQYPHLASSLPYNLGAALSDLGRYAESIAARQRVLAVNPTHAMSYRGLALAYVRWADVSGTSLVTRVERLEQAEVNMRQVLKIAPHFDGAQGLLAAIQQELAAARRDVNSDVK